MFDFSGMRISTTGYTVGFSVSGSWLHLKGFEVTGVPMNTRSNTGMTVSDSHDNYDPDSHQGNGAGFKMGSKRGIRHVIRHCVAWKNKNQGFYANHSSGGNTWHNNTAYDNGVQYDMLASTWEAQGNRTDGVLLTGSKRHVLGNNVAFPNATRNMQGVDASFNSWDLGLAPAEGDFLSVSDEGSKGPRRSDGSLPDIPFLKLRTGSRLLDRGTDVGLPFEGAAPDLGAYELGTTNAIAVTGQAARPHSLLRRGAFYEFELTGFPPFPDARLEVFHLQGRRLLSLPLQEGKARWQAASLPAGASVIRVTGAGGNRVLGWTPGQ